MNKFRRSTISLLKMTFLVSVAVSTVTISSPAQVRDIGLPAFLSQLAPNDAQAWSDPVSGNILVIDAYGKRNILLGLGLPTRITGKVTGRDLGDGTERVTVALKARDAICWGFDGNFTPAFGYSPAAVVNGLGPATLGDITYRIVYAPQPIGQFDAAGGMETFFATATCDGVLRAGSGYTDGTPGFAQTTQTGLFSTGVPSGCPREGDADCFPAEKVQFKATGN